MAKIFSPRLKMAERIAMATAAKVRRALGELARQQVKAASFLEEATLFQTELGKAFAEKLVESYPEDGFVVNSVMAKEANAMGEDAYTWHIQSLEGLGHFSRGQEGFYHLFTLFKNDEPLEALAYDPIADHVSVVQKGQGAYFADNRLRVSGRKTPQSATFCFCQETLPQAIKWQEKGAFIRITNLFLHDVVAVAGGHADAFYKKMPTRAEAGFAMLVLTESGGRTTPPTEKPFIGTNGGLYKHLKAV